jgi:hypothetical protein
MFDFILSFFAHRLYDVAVVLVFIGLTFLSRPVANYYWQFVLNKFVLNGLKLKGTYSQLIPSTVAWTAQAICLIVIALTAKHFSEWIFGLVIFFALRVLTYDGAVTV